MSVMLVRWIVRFVYPIHDAFIYTFKKIYCVWPAWQNTHHYGNSKGVNNQNVWYEKQYEIKIDKNLYTCISVKTEPACGNRLEFHDKKPTERKNGKIKT